MISGLYVALLRTGRVKRIIESAASSSKEFVKACEINISMSKDRERALQDPKAFLTHIIPGSYDALGLIEPLGIDKKKVEILKEKLSRGIAFDELKGMISDDDVKKCYIAGSPSECREQLFDVLDQTAKLGFERICFKLGPDYKETIELLGDEIIPELKGE